MTLLPYLSCLVGFLVFVSAVVARIVMWIRMPMHLRWELYPVPHEPLPQAGYGGSFMEESDWWTRPRETSRLGELKAMAPEILFLAAVREHSRTLWYRTFPFHFGLYLVAAAVGLTLLAGLLKGLVPEMADPTTTRVARLAVTSIGVAGSCLATLGALGLLHRRLADPVLRRFATLADLFNLAFFVAAFGMSLATFALVDSDGRRAFQFAENLVTAQWVAVPGTGTEVVLPALTTVLLSALVAYVPLTHMSHFVGKYFAYHAIRWNDAPNLRGGPQEAAIQRLLGQKVSWAAPHIQGAGQKTWNDLAVENPSASKS